MEVCKRLGGSFIVLDEPSKPRCPCEGPLHDPSSGQEHEAALGLRQLDDVKGDAVFGGRGGGLVAGVAVVDEGDLDAFAGLCLNGLGDPADLGAVVGMAGVTWSARRCPSVSTARGSFEPFFRLAPS